MHTYINKYIHKQINKQINQWINKYNTNNSKSQLIEGSLEVKLPTIWTDEKQRWEESEKRREDKRREEKRREEERRSKKRKSQKKEDPGARKGRKVAKHCVFPMICGPGGSKSGLPKAEGAQAHFQVNVQSTSASEHF